MTQPENTTTDLLHMLREHVVQVQFIKADGSVRTMMATLLPEHMPTKIPLRDTMPVTQVNTHMFKVWDMDKQAWRSFRTDRLQSWQVMS